VLAAPAALGLVLGGGPAAETLRAGLAARSSSFNTLASSTAKTTASTAAMPASSGRNHAVCSSPAQSLEPLRANLAALNSGSSDASNSHPGVSRATRPRSSGSRLYPIRAEIPKAVEINRFRWRARLTARRQDIATRTLGLNQSGSSRLRN
jgi:hypothetical protein